VAVVPRAAPTGARTALVLDTDIGTDVDDALALALALRHPAIELVAVTTVSGDARARAHIAARLLAIAGATRVEVAAGVGGFAARAWMGHEGEGLGPGPETGISGRDAVTVLLDRSHGPDPPVVATVGMPSNVAAAVAADPDYVTRVPMLTVMGGAFRRIESFGLVLGPERDHNLVTDPASSVRALNAGFATLYVPCDVTFGVPLTRGQLERLRRADDFCRALASLVDIWAVVLHRRWGGALPDDVVAMLHDPLTVACAVERRFVSVERWPVTVALHRGIPRTFLDPIDGVDADVVTAVDADAFADWWLETVVTA
jgi:purine nucleosidase